MLKSDKVDFKIKTTTKDKEEHFIMITRSIHQEDITIINHMCLITELQNT